MSAGPKRLLKLGITVAALWYVLRRIDPDTLIKTLLSADPFWLAVAFFLFNASKIASAFRLNLYFRALGVRLSEWQNLSLYYVGMFYNLFLPGGIGGDGYKVYLLARRFHTGVKPLLGAVFWDRISGLAALILYASVLSILSDYGARLGPWGVMSVFVGGLLTIPAVWWATRRYFPAFLAVFRQTTAWGLGVQLLQLLSALAILAAIGVDRLRLEYLTLFLLSSVAAVLPVSIGGVGVRELTFLYGLAMIGQPPEKGVTFSFLFFIITALSSLAGLFVQKKAVGEAQEETNG